MPKLSLHKPEDDKDFRHFTFRLSPEDKEVLDILAKKHHGTSRTKLIRYLIAKECLEVGIELSDDLKNDFAIE
jgi:predicted DNA-binding protein